MLADVGTVACGGLRGVWLDANTPTPASTTHPSPASPCPLFTRLLQLRAASRKQTTKVPTCWRTRTSRAPRCASRSAGPRVRAATSRTQRRTPHWTPRNAGSKRRGTSSPQPEVTSSFQAPSTHPLCGTHHTPAHKTKPTETLSDTIILM